MARLSRSVIGRIVPLVVLLLVATFAAYHYGWLQPSALARWAEALRARPNQLKTAIGFVVLMGAATSLGIPGFPFTLIAGAVYGTLTGATVAWCGCLLGAVGGYYVAHLLGQSTVRRWLCRYELFDRMQGANGFLTLFRLRVVPLVPLSVVNFAAGLARVRLGPYLLATALGLIPSNLVYAYFADSVLASVGGAKAEATRDLIWASALLIGLSLLPMLAKRRGWV